MEKASVRADCPVLRGYPLHARPILVLMCLLLAGCIRPAVPSAPSAVIPCRYSPAESWRSEPCTGDCSHAMVDILPSVRDSAVVADRVIKLRRSAGMATHWAAPIQLQALILEDGSVQEVTLRRSGGDSQVDKAALSLAKHLRFTPRKINNRSVRSLVDLVLSPAGSADPPLTCTLQG